MRAHLCAIALAGFVAMPVLAAAPPKASLDTPKIEELTGAKGALNEKEGVFKVSFLHYWGIGETEDLAKGLKAALDTQHR